MWGTLLRSIFPKPSGLNCQKLLPFAVILGISFIKMRLLTLPVLFSLIILSPGCKNGASKPSNPFAQNLQTVAPPATFSSQDLYLGQTPGSYILQTPASAFPSSGTYSPTQPATMPSNILPSEATGHTSSAATRLDSTEKQSDWSPVDVVSTSQTAFQAMDAKVKSTLSSESGMVKTVSGISESWVVGSSHIVTTIAAESPSADLSEPQQLLYADKYAE